MDAKMHDNVIVVPYDPNWKDEFRKISAMIENQVGNLILGIDHVGSTSVEGLAGKPIIDMDVVIDSYDVFPEIKRCLGDISFIHEGNEGVEGREVFKRSFVDEFMPYHLYVTPKDSRPHIEHLLYRDYLRSHPKVVTEYAALKIKLAEKFPHDIDSYFREKSKFVEKILNELE